MKQNSDDSNQVAKFRTRPHWLAYSNAVILAALIFPLGKVEGEMANYALLAMLVLSVLSIFSLLATWTRRVSTKIEVTNRGLVCRTGILSRRNIEMALDKVESVDVDQTLLGRLFGYGNVTVRGVGASIDPFYGIADPQGLRRALLER